MLKEQREMKKELDALEREKSESADTMPSADQPASQNATHNDDAASHVETELEQMRSQIHRALPGTEHLVIAGDASVGFVNQKKTNSTFTAGASPLFLWEPTDRLLFEAAFDINIATDSTNSSATTVDLTIADGSYIVNDWLIVGGGLFVVPFGQYHNHFDPPWINKLPDDPLVFSDGGLAPSSELGIYARGAVSFPVIPGMNDAKLSYDVYLTNGPNLITSDPAAAGSLNFHDFTDLNNGKAIGGRIAMLPVPNLEFGYSAEFAQVAPSGFHHVYALLQAVDVNWVQEVRPIFGTITFRGEWAWSNVEKATYDPNHALGFGPLRFNNQRNGGYALISYRPTLAQNRIVRNVEAVFRYDRMDSPLLAPGGNHEQRFAIGVDYWLTSSAVIKVFYEFDERKVGSGQDAVFVQFGIGL